MLILDNIISSAINTLISFYLWLMQQYTQHKSSQLYPSISSAASKTSHIHVNPKKMTRNDCVGKDVNKIKDFKHTVGQFQHQFPLSVHVWFQSLSLSICFFSKKRRKIQFDLRGTASSCTELSTVHQHGFVYKVYIQNQWSYGRVWWLPWGK